MADLTVTNLNNYLNREGYNLNYKDLNIQLLSNPDYPSVKSITDTFDYFNVDNMAANVPKDALDQLPNFFLAIINKDHRNVIAQIEKKHGKIKVLDNNGEKSILTVNAFKESWNGTIVAIEHNENTFTKGYGSIFKHPLTLVTFIAVLTVINTLFHFNFLNFFYLITSVLGLYISYFIILEDLGLYNDSTAKICNSSAKNTGCSQVINSKTSKLFKHIVLSDASVTYFVSLFLILPTLGYNAIFFLLTAIISLPIILFTIYQQVVVIKTWCPLCLVISTILLIQAGFTFFTVTTLSIDIKFLSNSLIIFCVVYYLWLQLKALLKDQLKLDQTEADFLKFKRNDLLFNTLLKQSPLSHGIDLDKRTSIIFGNPDASITINAITNPLCGYCTTAFHAYCTLLKKHPDRFNLNVIFNVPSNNLKQTSSQISQRIIEIYQSNNEEAFEAMKHWFEIRDITVWQNQYGFPTEDTLLTILQTHEDICNRNGIRYTPATIINDYIFPKAYEITELSFFMDNLTQKEITKKSLV